MEDGGLSHKIFALQLDDAFTDGDDDDSANYSFSPESLRQDIARAIISPSLASESGPSATSETGFLNFKGSAVSALDVDSAPPVLHDDVDSAEVDGATSPANGSAEFTQIPLSGSTGEEEHDVDEEEVRPDPAPYPTVLIDASKSPAHRVTVPPEHIADVKASITPASAPALHMSRATPSPSHSCASSLSIPASAPLPASDCPPRASSVPDHTNDLYEAPRKSGHRVRHSGPSMFEKVRNQTRPVYLPPKSRHEDDKHLADWQSMMKQSRSALEKRRRAEETEHARREKHKEELSRIWDDEIAPDWTVVQRSPRHRHLWWEGIPPKHRAAMWTYAVGNALALSKDHYRTCLARAKRALSSGTFPPSTLTTIENDISTTLRSLKVFNTPEAPMYPDLKDMLCAWVIARSDEGLGYTSGAARIAAMLLVVMPALQAFVVMRNLLESHCLRSLYGGEGTKREVALFRIFDTLLADGMPKTYFNFKQHQISPAAYLPDWLTPLFLDHLPFEMCARLWDVILLEGDSFLFRASLGILAVLEPRLFFPDRQELLDLLRGENKAAIQVAERQNKIKEGAKYEIYDFDERTLWQHIEDMKEWWKESTWKRLIQRELPDL
ncbi:RabGAP/TBC [Fistulina hepatica ATCC 64428]|uniref:RabGAP/TBC n=1 Tax=Fistulina hepatica ATCC 64428 TaxID=1128425 RepID=A0A0D7A5H8_9AGAR|nr:RabGAP/TBC [Fistulina hepatica ATCC 64428]